MLRSHVYRLICDRRLSVPLMRSFHHDFTNPKPLVDEKLAEQEEHKQGDVRVKATGAFQQKYKLFRDDDAPEIFDVEEERHRYQTQDQTKIEDGEFLGLNLERGVKGVFDIEDLVDVLRMENAVDIFVCTVPKDLKYVDHFVVCSGLSYRHMLALAEYVRRVFKKKCDRGDVLPKIEGEKSREWMAMDLGNIALHIFSPSAREEYDLESLWAIGSEYDRECNKKDAMTDLFSSYAALIQARDKAET